MRFALRLTSLLVACTFIVSSSHADSFSFQGIFTHDNDVQAFTFIVGAPSLVTLQTFSYAGGTNAQGSQIARGGFDPILALFSGTGPSAAYIGQNDDGGAGFVPADLQTGQYFDTYLQQILQAGTYTVTVMQFDNFSNLGTLGNGFRRDSEQDFTALRYGCPSGQFCSRGVNRDSHWAFDITGVNAADQVGSGPVAVTPEPSSLALLGTGLLGIAGAARRRYV